LDNCPNSMNTARRALGGTGTQTAGLAFGGYDTGNIGATEEYDGTSWTSSPKFKYSKKIFRGAGIQTAALAFGGSTATATEEYDGTAWTSKI
jgi:hypothetical protein